MKYLIFSMRVGYIRNVIYAYQKWEALTSNKHVKGVFKLV